METFSALLAFVRGIHRSPVNSPHKGQWCGFFMFSLICARINCWINNRKAGDCSIWRHCNDICHTFHCFEAYRIALTSSVTYYICDQFHFVISPNLRLFTTPGHESLSYFFRTRFFFAIRLKLQRCNHCKSGTNSLQITTLRWIRGKK